MSNTLSLFSLSIHTHSIPRVVLVHQDQSPVTRDAEAVEGEVSSHACSSSGWFPVFHVFPHAPTRSDPWPLNQEYTENVTKNTTKSLGLRDNTVVRHLHWTWPIQIPEVCSSPWHSPLTTRGHWTYREFPRPNSSEISKNNVDELAWFAGAQWLETWERDNFGVINTLTLSLPLGSRPVLHSFVQS